MGACCSNLDPENSSVPESTPEVPDKGPQEHQGGGGVKKATNNTNDTSPVPSKTETNTAAKPAVTSASVSVPAASAFPQLRNVSNKTKLTMVAVGLDNSGKTTLVNNICKESLETSPTMGFDVDETKFTYSSGSQDVTVPLRLFGLSGARSWRGFWNQYFDELKKNKL